MASRATSSRRLGLGRAASGLVRDARARRDLHAIVRALTGREECLPRDARRIVDPRFLRVVIAACRFALLEDRAAGLLQAGVDILQLGLVLHLNAEMVEAFPPAAR